MASITVPRRGRRARQWPPEDTEESGARSDHHPMTIMNISLAINELARSPLGGG